MKKRFYSTLVTKLIITSCSSDDMPIQEQTTNYTVPSTYTFERSNTLQWTFQDKAVAY
jgi:hypothetical protein